MTESNTTMARTEAGVSGKAAVMDEIHHAVQAGKKLSREYGDHSGPLDNRLDFSGRSRVHDRLGHNVVVQEDLEFDPEVYTYLAWVGHWDGTFIWALYCIDRYVVEG